MTNSQRLATVRDRLIQWIADHADSSDTQTLASSESAGSAVDASQAGTSPIQRESILIRDGFYCGRRFDLEAHRAVWFLEEDEVKIYGSNGKLLVVLSGPEIGLPSQSQDEDGPAEPQILRLPVSDDASQPRQAGADDQDNQDLRRAA